jgi:Nif-specific regulatory protein
MSRTISATLHAKASQSVIVAPLTTVEKTLGVIYLETTDMNHRFDEAHLQLVSAIANSAAIAIENARHLEWLETQLWNEDAAEYKMLGESKAMQEVFRMISRVAPASATVLLGGESGTGKELVARALHRGSPRKNKPYMKVDCTQLSSELIESELFGHEKGAFTTAIVQKKGKLEVADGGTVFLDEIGELVPAVQAKLLRVLEDREFERVGSNRSIKVDVRIIAATHRDLQQAVREGKFREDLYFRLNVVRITVPPLRERKSDVAELAEHFAARVSAGTGRRIRGISSEALELLRHYDWPGNVRELRNTIERAVVLGTSDMILPDDLVESIIESDRSPTVKVTGYNQAVNEFKKELVIQAIDEAGGNITKAAAVLDLHPNNLHRLIRNLNIRDEIRSTPPRP